jgi:hypothetical protein
MQMAIAPVDAKSTNPKIAAVKGENTAGGTGVHGFSATEFGVLGESTSGRGVVARSDTSYGLRAGSRTLAGVRAHSETGVGVEGESRGAGTGVVGSSKSGIGTEGRAESAADGVLGTSKGGTGVHGQGQVTGVIGEGVTGHGVAGFSKSAKNFGVFGEANGAAVVGVSKSWHGVAGETRSENGGAGVSGEHKGSGVGVMGVSKSGVGVLGKGGKLAGFFEGDVEVTGDLRLTNADCAENFDVADADDVDAGTVMVVGDEGVLYESQQQYDKRVAGVVSGAGAYRPAIVLDTQPARRNRMPIALLGKTYCKVDARFGAIEVGDLLTTSPTPGHAMKTNDPFRAFGAVIGKALRPLTEGQGLIPILIALQ